MIHFAWPLMFVVLPLPFLVQTVLSAGRENATAIRVPFFSEIKEANRKRRFIRGGKNLRLLWLLWALLVTAAARPQMSSGLQEYTVPVRDIILALDVSRSMLQDDMNEGGKTRLDAVKRAATAFVGMRENDRIGIVLFSEQTSLYVPLTVDTPALTKMLEGVQAGLLGSLTAVGDALGLSLKYLEEGGAEHKVVVLLTDGVSNAGNVSPEQALKAAEKAGVKVYTIGVGKETRENGTGIDAAFLKRAAVKTGGMFFMAEDGMAVDNAYREISKHEPNSDASVYLIPQKELYFWPLLVFALIVTFVVLTRLAERVMFARRS